MLVQIASDVLYAVPISLANMLAVLVSALLSVLLVSFFRGESTVFKNLYQVIIFVTGTLTPILGIVAGIGILLRAQRKGEEAQRELLLLFTLVFFALSYYGLVRIPEFTIGS